MTLVSRPSTFSSDPANSAAELDRHPIRYRVRDDDVDDVDTVAGGIDGKTRANVLVGIIRNFHSNCRKEGDCVGIIARRDDR